MSSSVFFKFKSQKEPSRVIFDGTGISVFELKREIININRLGDGNDFDLAIFNEDTNEEYDDDTTIIPRSTSIVAKRLPPARANRGSAARYVSGKMPVTAKNSSRVEKGSSAAGASSGLGQNGNALAEMNSAQTEEEKIAAMFKAGAEQWDQQKKEMANATPIFRPGGGAKGKAQAANLPDHPPPSGYICYRCGEKGHWIQQCPTNDDPNFDGRPRVKRTTGIPRSFLKTVAKPEALSKDGLGDASNQPSGVMVNAEGEFVVAEPDSASWEQFRAKAIASEQAQKLASKGNKELQDLGLECPIDNRLFVDPTKTPCCGKVYCNECITNALLEGDLTCPNCQTEGIILDELATDEEMVVKVNDYKKESETKSRNSEEVESPKANDTAAESPKVKISVSESEPTETAPARDSTVTPSGLSSTSNGSKKRPAEDELDSTRIPKAPAAMRQQQVQQNKSGPPSGFSQMPFSQMPMPMGMPPGPNGMPDFGFSQAGGYMGMDPSMMNPMMTGGFGGGFSGMGAMNGMNVVPGMNGMGYPQFNGMYNTGFNGGMPNGYNPMGMAGNGMNPGMMGAQNMNMNTMPQNMNPNGQGMFPNQQQVGNALQTDEDNPYFRQPVNPHRHQGRQQRRPRPSDYREL